MTATEQQPHLWEVDHDFYGPDDGYSNKYESWQDFLDGDGHQITGMNLLYRWDWQAWHLQFPEDYPDEKEEHQLQLFWMMPRKSAMGNDTINVTPADEPAVREWLQKHADYMRKLWAPLEGTL